MAETMGVTKDYSHFVIWIFSLLLLNLQYLPVTAQGNMTETATEIPVTTSSLEGNYTSDGIMTSMDVNMTTVSTDIQTEMATENVTEFKNATLFEEGNMTETATEIPVTTSSLEANYTSDGIMTSMDVNMTTVSTDIQTEMATEFENATVFKEELQTEWVTETATELGNMTTSQEGNQTTDEISENTTEILMEAVENQTEIATEITTLTEKTGPLDNDSTPLPVNTTAVPPPSATFGQTTIIPLTTDMPNSSKEPTFFVQSFIIPMLIFMALLFLLVIMVFVVIVTKSKMKRSASTYNLNQAANGNASQIGYHNTAYGQGDVADDTDVECSMQEIRLEGKPTNGSTVHNYGGFEEELTPL